LVFFVVSAALDAVEEHDRLHVLAPTKVCRGRVILIRRHNDGDYHVHLNPDVDCKPLMNPENEGVMVTEVVPERPVPLPNVGDYVEISGRWVLDRTKGWLELHPVDRITVLSPRAP
jgi:hypothetical protein